MRLVEHNVERFEKRILARPGASGSLLLAPSNADDVDRIAAVLRSWPALGEGTTGAVLARTNRELIPAAVAALRLGMPFAAPELELPVESPFVEELLERAAHFPPGPLLPRLFAAAPGTGSQSLGDVLAWAAAFRDLEELRAAVRAARGSIADLRRDDAPLSLATAHGTKGLEFDHVAVIGLEAGRFPSARSIAEAVEPERALEEERRLAYVAWTRARRSLALVYDPGAPSPFLLEAFSDIELGVSTAAAGAA